jgi:hypothetical protein
VPAGSVRSCDELAVPQRLVGENLAREAHRADRARIGVEGRPDLVLGGWTRGRAEPRRELGLVEAVVATDEGEHERAVPVHHRHRLGRRRGVDSEEFGQALDRRRARRLHLLGLLERRRELRRARNSASDLEIGRVVAVLAGDECVLARP